MRYSLKVQVRNIHKSNYEKTIVKYMQYINIWSCNYSYLKTEVLMMFQY